MVVMIVQKELCQIPDINTLASLYEPCSTRNRMYIVRVSILIARLRDLLGRRRSIHIRLCN
jgi:hypothetical protein